MNTYAKFAGWVVPFGFSMAILYLIGYWAPFGVNALEYVTLSDVATVAMFPLVVVLFAVVIGMAWGSLLPNTATRLDKLIIGSEDEKHRPKVLAAAVLAVIASFAFFPEPYRWLIVWVAGTLIWNRLRFSLILRNAIPDYRVLVFSVMLGPLLLFIAFFSGRAAAYRVLDGKPPRIMVPGRSALALNADPAHPAAFLGNLGPMAFFFESKTRAVVIAPTTEAAPIAYVRRPDPATVSEMVLGTRDPPWVKQPATPAPATSVRPVVETSSTSRPPASK